jgi:methionine salvage enolase-phosphatase E1
MEMVNKFIKLHWGLFLFLRRELPKKRTAKQLIYFLTDIAKRYFQIHLQEYRNLFNVLDPEYRKQKAEYERKNDIKKDLQRALKILHYVDVKMVKAGKNRQERRSFWRDFYKNGEVRNDVFKDLDKEIG